MMDAMGQAAALTGGYSSSYGQAVGQQQYNAYLQQLNEVVPELYGMAYQRYQDEGDALMNQYSMMGQLADDEYNKYLDSLNAYWKNVEYLQGQADDTYNRGLQYAELAYEKRQDAYNNLVDMITQLGYVPTADELEEAGMSQSQFQSYINYYYSMNAPSAASSGGGGGGYSYNPTNPGVTDPTVNNSNGDGWVQVPGYGRMSYQELENAVNNGTIKENVLSDGSITYSRNTTSSNKTTSSSSNKTGTSAATVAAATTGTNVGSNAAVSNAVGSAVADALKKIFK